MSKKFSKITNKVIKSHKGLLTFEGFQNKNDFDIALNDFLDSDEGMEVLKRYFDDVYKIEQEEALIKHTETMEQLEDEEDELISALNDLEDIIKDKELILSNLKDEISRRELAEQYLKRNNIFEGRKNSLEERILMKSDVSIEAKDSLMTENVVTKKGLTPSQELSFTSYNKNGRLLNECKRLVESGLTFEASLEQLNAHLDRSKRELIIQGEVTLREGHQISFKDMTRHLY